MDREALEAEAECQHGMALIGELTARAESAEAERDRLRAACETAAKAIGLMERDEELYLKTCGMLIDILEREAPNPSFERLQFIVNVRLALAKSATARAALAGAAR